MKAFINSLRPNHPFIQTLDNGQRTRFAISHKRNTWIDWDNKYKRLTISFGK